MMAFAWRKATASRALAGCQTPARQGFFYPDYRNSARTPSRAVGSARSTR